MNVRATFLFCETFTLLVGCGSTTPGSMLAAADAAVDHTITVDSGTADADADPIGLGSCAEPIGDLAHVVKFPAPTWQNRSPTDEHATFCALRALDMILPAKAIVCAGEDSHGVAESSALVAMIAKYLAFHREARTFVFEAPDAGLAYAQAFIRTGDPAQLAKYWEGVVPSLGRNNEFEKLLNALHDIDTQMRDGPRIELRGMDVAVQVNSTLDRLTAFYQRVDPVSAMALTIAAPRDNALTIPGLTAAAQHVAGLVTDLESKQAAYTASTDASSWELAHEDALNLRDGYLFLTVYFQGDFVSGDAKYREPGLARNLRRFAENATAAIVVYAHNAHCAKGGAIGTSATVGTIVASDAELGPRYFVIAQGYAEGSQTIFANRTFGTTTVANSFGAGLGMVDPSDAFLLGTNSTDFPMTRGWAGLAGGAFVPASDFDVLAFVRHVTPTTPKN
jgi:erythromycin esterase-like protein